MNPSCGRTFFATPGGLQRPYDAICIFGVVNTSVSRIASFPARISGPVYKSVIQHAIKCPSRWKEEEAEGPVGERNRKKARAAVVNRNYEARCA